MSNSTLPEDCIATYEIQLHPAMLLQSVRQGQARMITLAGEEFSVPERGHWYSPEAVLEMIEADRLNRAEAT